MLLVKFIRLSREADASYAPSPADAGLSVLSAVRRRLISLASAANGIASPDPAWDAMVTHAIDIIKE